MLLLIAQQLLSDIRHQRVRRVRIGQQRAHAQQHLAHRQRRAPVVLQNIKANAPLRVDIAMIDPRLERDLGRFERVVGRKGNVEEENAWQSEGSTSERRVSLRSVRPLARSFDESLGAYLQNTETHWARSVSTPTRRCYRLRRRRRRRDLVGK